MNCLCFEKKNAVQYTLISTYNVNDQKLIRHRNIACCLVCNQSIVTNNDTLLECNSCNRIIGHAKCFTHAWPKINVKDCINCGALYD